MPTRNVDLVRRLGDIPYTEKEQAVYKMIALADGAIESTKIVKSIYRDRQRPPRNARIIVGGILNSLSQKLDFNGHRFALAKSERRGPHPIAWELIRRDEATARRAARDARAAVDARVRAQQRRTRRLRRESSQVAA